MYHNWIAEQLGVAQLVDGWAALRSAGFEFKCVHNLNGHGVSSRLYVNLGGHWFDVRTCRVSVFDQLRVAERFIPLWEQLLNEASREAQEMCRWN